MRTAALLLAFAALGAAVPARADEAAIEKRLSLIAEKQDRILRALDEIKAELQIVKVRATK